MKLKNDPSLTYAPGHSRPRYVSKGFFRILANAKYLENDFEPHSGMHAAANRKYRRGKKLKNKPRRPRHRRPKTGSSRSEAEFSLVLNLCNIGYNRKEIYQIFDTFACQMSKYSQIKEEYREKYMDSMLKAARKYLVKSEKHFDLKLASIACGVVLSEQYTPSQKATLIGLLNICRIARKFRISASVRDISMLSNLGIASVSASIKSMAPEIRASQSLDIRRANSYDLSSLEPPTGISSDLPDFKKWNTIQLDIPLQHDIFHSHGVGFLGWLILALMYLKGEPQKIGDLTRICGYSTSRFSSVLSQLKKLHLVKVTGRKCEISEAYDLDWAAQELGVFGSLESQKLRYEYDRFNFHSTGLKRMKANQTAHRMCYDLHLELERDSSLSPFQRGIKLREALDAAELIEMERLYALS